MIEILHIEDNPDDAELIQRQITRAGIEARFTLVQDAQAFAENLEKKKFDLIISDFTMPALRGTAALEMARSKFPEIPFLFVSGTIGEDLAIQAMRSGATDYVLKQNLKRLVPSVTRALHEAREKEEKKKIEEQLRQAQKMELVGRLVSGVAHDFNNILTVIQGYTELLTENLPEGTANRVFVQEISNAATRAASLTGQLLAFSKKQRSTPGIVDVNQVVLRMEKMLTRLIGDDVSLTINVCSEPAYILADQNQLEQVLMNLAVNGREAMPRGGKMHIETTLRTGGPTAEAGEDKKEVLLTVSDNGCGMSEDISAQIFEPFFTTKQSGTGLGLATVRNIVQESMGKIEIESAVDRGTSFLIVWPCASGSAQSSSEKSVVASAAAGDSTILLVEDDTALRALFTKALTHAGYRIVAARDAEEAETLFDQHRDSVDIVLTDIVLSKMSGPEFADRLRSTAPDVRILFMSGHTAEIFEKYAIDSEKVNFIQKPFTSRELLTRIRELTGARAVADAEFR